MEHFEDSVVPLERNLYGHALAGLLWERQFEEAFLELGWEKNPNWECMFVHRKQGLFLSVFVDDIKNGWKKAEFGSHLEKCSNLHHFLTTCIWDAPKENANQMKPSLKIHKHV